MVSTTVQYGHAAGRARTTCRDVPTWHGEVQIGLVMSLTEDVTACLTILHVAALLHGLRLDKRLAHATLRHNRNTAYQTESGARICCIKGGANACHTMNKDALLV